MSILDPRSLAATVNNLTHAMLSGQTLSPAEEARTAKWIAGRVGAPNTYAGLPAPTESDRAVRMFTGEKVRSGAGTGCKLGFEGARALVVLGGGDAAVKAAREAALGAADWCYENHLRLGYKLGVYCCGSCSCAGWRLLSTGALARSHETLAAAVKVLHARRDGRGWGKFPFWYTLLAMLDVDVSLAGEELKYAAPGLEKWLARGHGRDLLTARRRLVAEAALAKC